VSELLNLSFKRHVSRALKCARSRIWLATYVLTANNNRASDPVACWLNILKDKHDRGDIDVRVSLDWPKANRPNYNCNRYYTRWLLQQQIPVRVLTAGYALHAKILLVDDWWLFVGSHNWAPSSIMNAHELTVLHNDPKMIDQAEKYYIWLWNRCTAPDFGAKKKGAAYGNNRLHDIR